MDKILAFVEELLDYLREFKAADIIAFIKSFFENPVQPR